MEQTTEQRPVEVLNARIVNTQLGWDGSVMNSSIQLKAQHLGVNFGGYILYAEPQNIEQQDSLTSFAIEYIGRVLSTVGVATWEALNGQACRIAIQGNMILGIGNLIDDVWFYPREFGEQHQQRAEEQAKAMDLYRRWQANPADVATPKPEVAGPENELVGAGATAEPEQPEQPEHPLDGDGQAPAN